MILLALLVAELKVPRALKPIPVCFVVTSKTLLTRVSAVTS